VSPAGGKCAKDQRFGDRWLELCLKTCLPPETPPRYKPITLKGSIFGGESRQYVKTMLQQLHWCQQPDREESNRGGPIPGCSLARLFKLHSCGCDGYQRKTRSKAAHEHVAVILRRAWAGKVAMRVSLLFTVLFGVSGFIDSFQTRCLRLLLV
jgi:hypothetical protein